MNEKKILDVIPTIFSLDKSVVVGPGDDCAVLDLGGNKLFLMAVDQLVADIHYLPQTTSPANIAKKLLKRNISDIAAMGGTPAHALLTMQLSEKTGKNSNWIKEFLTAISDESDLWGISICGGDISSTKSENDSFSLTITGWVDKENLCLRSNAEEGDLIFVTGLFGRSFFTQHHLTFTPRVEASNFLAGKFSNTMIDVSDGLLLDLARIAESSTLAAVLDVSCIPGRDNANDNEKISDGEDYELIFTVPPALKESLFKQWPFKEIELTCIGQFSSGPVGQIIEKNGELLYPLENRSGGFDHFKV